mmetsp:Transcript_40/g.54  ORF Transcript_40/g.54 Transcript_40/m.54 type:complete len:88 (+) Transcript_40:208-471(+)|eukprot:CAMPEP_0184022616 /NCGR_PEP_ID=MMETSP0954-20121128/10732_1 /TAXON_ID=627963 /ORGANISM="Aplanochytrium sp, Strain PBS07" /LENGTH=87 /DNA_ID=CAMNT_0026305065 /DNA_START=216 /DNA_END=479 /DNA_ORIENTATION=+
MAPKGVTPAINMVKWWKSYIPIKYQVTRTISPFQQDVITPFIKNAPKQIQHKISDNLLDVGPALLLGIGIVAWGDATYEAEMKKHRS